jgi:hypothetical protein
MTKLVTKAMQNCQAEETQVHSPFKNGVEMPAVNERRPIILAGEKWKKSNGLPVRDSTNAPRYDTPTGRLFPLIDALQG